IDGVPGAAAPIALCFRNIAGGKTGALLPTCNACDTVNGVPVTCIDLAMPMVLAPAAAFGKTGYESKAALDGDDDFLARLEKVRREAARRMGLGDVAGSVLPKVALLAKPRNGSGVSSRYFVPDRCHAAHAATGAICIAGAALIEGSVAHAVCQRDATDPAAVRVEHPKGTIEITLDADKNENAIAGAAVIRTARPIFMGSVLVPAALWPAEEVQPLAA
ncbi:MAG: 4-oxalomesaconate tautomerase, partial [Alphaproteobacteria bacterium]|nr:4-oxalomesaconate tautomerase [Alphaproteobacteria bacterium]